MDSIAQVLEIVAVILLLGAVGEFVFSRTGIPDVLWLVCAGVVAGPVFGLVSPTLLQPAVPLFGAVALTIILSGGASRLRVEDVAAAGPRGRSWAWRDSSSPLPRSACGSGSSPRWGLSRLLRSWPG